MLTQLGNHIILVSNQLVGGGGVEAVTETPAPQPTTTSEPSPTAPAPTTTTVTDPATWPPVITDLQYQMVTMPSGAQVRVDYQVTYGELLVAAVVTLALVVQVGRWLWERIREVL